MKISHSTRWMIRRIIRVALVLFFFGVPCAIIYLREVGFNASMRQKVCELMHARGLDMEIQRLTFDPFQGVIAQDVKLRAVTQEAPVLAQINRMGFSFNLRALLQGHVELDTAFLHGARLALPLDVTKPTEQLELNSVNALVLFLPDEIRVASLECMVGLIKLETTGSLLNPKRFLIPKSTSGKPENGPDQTLKDIRRLGSRFSLEGGRSRLEFQFVADFANLDAARVDDIHFQASDIHYNGTLIRRVEISSNFHDGELRIERMVIADSIGEFTARGEIIPAEQRLSFEASSTIDIRLFLPDEIAHGALLKDVKFVHPPEAALSGQLWWKDKSKISGQVYGKIRLPQIKSRGVEIKDINAEYTWKDGIFFAEDLTLHVGNEKASMDVYFAPDDFRLRIDSSLRPTEFLPWFDKGVRETVGRMEFSDAPKIHVELLGKAPNPDVLSGTGQLTLGKTAMRGAWITSGKSALSIQGRAVTFQNMEVTIGSNKGTGSFTYDFGQQEVRIFNVKSQLPPYEVLMWANPKVAEAVLPYRFKSPPSASVSGVVGLNGSEKNHLDVTIDASTGLTYALLGKDLSFGAVKGKLLVRKDQLDLNISQAKLYGGQIKLQAAISLGSQNPGYTANILVDRCDFTTLTKLYFDYNNSQGKVSGNYQFRTNFTDPRSMVGNGKLIVEDGNVFAIPLLGPLSEILNQIIPGAGYQKAREATADFDIANGVISTKNLRIEGAAFSLYGHGKILFMDDKLDMSIRINARGIPGLILFPVSKVFEYTSDGSLKNPTWRPKLIPKAIFGSGEKTH